MIVRESWLGWIWSTVRAGGIFFREMFLFIVIVLPVSVRTLPLMWGPLYLVPMWVSLYLLRESPYVGHLVSYVGPSVPLM